MEPSVAVGQFQPGLIHHRHHCHSDKQRSVETPRERMVAALEIGRPGRNQVLTPLAGSSLWLSFDDPAAHPRRDTPLGRSTTPVGSRVVEAFAVSADRCGGLGGLLPSGGHERWHQPEPGRS